jgi:tRNA dimethylallyltransferase
MNMMVENEFDKKLITILGPTATGKTQLAAHLAYRLDGEIISADSRQIYRNMDIGTGKDLADFTVNGKQIRYHLIDIVDPGYEFNVFEYQHHFNEAYNNILNRQKQPILCGGSGLYIQAVLEGYNLLHVPPDPELRLKLEDQTDIALEEMLSNLAKLHNVSDTSSRKRMIRAIEIGMYYKMNNIKEMNLYPPIDSKIFGVCFEREIVRQRITERLKFRLNHGMIKEVESILDSGISPDKLKYYGLEYKYITMFILEELTYNEMFERLNIAIHQFSKRQMTWFRKMEKDGFNIIWINGSLSLDEKIELILNDIEK